jgi:hypothetical protein
MLFSPYRDLMTSSVIVSIIPITLLISVYEMSDTLVCSQCVLNEVYEIPNETRTLLSIVESKGCFPSKNADCCCCILDLSKLCFICRCHYLNKSCISCDTLLPYMT